jgi:predicted transcriptional regulator
MIEQPLGISKDGEKNHALAEMIKAIGEECRNCAPLTPLDCISRCHIWKIKNELRMLHGTLDNPNFIKELFNVLKNNTRLQILRAIVKSRQSVDKLQEQLRKEGYAHSQETINEEYLRPLISVGLAAETQEQYYATIFGGKLNDLLEGFPDFVEILPAHSECYEETALDALLPGPKTFEEMEACLPPNTASRILKRLKLGGLIDAPEERDYIFFFQSKRDPAKERFAETERKVYGNIPSEGISAKKLAEKTGISLRRTYKYLRGLKGKKLIFTRRTPKVYTLTAKGEKLALLLSNLQSLVDEVWQSSEHVVSLEKS